MAEQLAVNQQVVGSKPAIPAKSHSGLVECGDPALSKTLIATQQVTGFLLCPLDGMVDMPDLESGAAMCVSSSLTGGTKYILQ